MKIDRLIVVVAMACTMALAQSAPAPKVLKVYVQGDSSRLTDFVTECQREFVNHGLKLQLVPYDGDFDYNIVIAQESSLGGAAASVIALDKRGLLVASVVRSGRMSGKGAFNATAKELAKKLAVFVPR
jgi:ABC-type glycerol-3-phosphate transport system substrate-binding protein